MRFDESERSLCFRFEVGVRYDFVTAKNREVTSGGSESCLREPVEVGPESEFHERILE